MSLSKVNIYRVMRSTVSFLGTPGVGVVPNFGICPNRATKKIFFADGITAPLFLRSRTPGRFT